jgi:hypothetical protein
MRTLKSGLLRRLNEEVKNETRVEQIAERSAREKVEREGYKLLSQGGLDQRWLDDNADNLSGTAFRRLSQGLSSRRFGRNDPSVYGDLLLRATDDPDGVLRDATAAYSRGQIDKPAYDRLTAAAERRESEGDNRPGWALDIRRDMIRRLRPSNLQDPDQARRQLDAVFSFDDWLTANPQTTREQARDQMDLLVDRHRDTAARNERSTLPIPMFAQSSRDAMSPDALPAIADRLRRAHAAGEVDETIFLEQVENLQRWRDVLQRAPRGAR